MKLLQYGNIEEGDELCFVYMIPICANEYSRIVEGSWNTVSKSSLWMEYINEILSI